MAVIGQRRIPLLDFKAQHQPLREEILSAVARVIDSNQFILGNEVKQLEDAIAAYTGVPYAIGCASGSDALSLSLMAIGVTRGDTVITTPFTFFSTAGSITREGATPVFADIDLGTFNIDPHAVAAALRRHPRAKAIIPVHLFGGCADMDPILDLAREYGCAVIEDGAQSIGARYKDRNAQSMGDIACLSFYPTKNLGGAGDGGMCVTKEEKLAKTLASLRVHGGSRRYYHDRVGVNSRLDTVQAAVLLVKFRRLDQWTEGRRTNAALYRRLLEGGPVTLPVEAPYQTRHVYNQFCIRAPRRDELKQYLQDNGVGSEIYYPLPLHLQACYRGLGYREGDFPHSERAAREVLALPIHSDLARDDIEYICHLIHSFYRQG